MASSDTRPLIMNYQTAIRKHDERIKATQTKIDALHGQRNSSSPSPPSPLPKPPILTDPSHGLQQLKDRSAGNGNSHRSVEIAYLFDLLLARLTVLTDSIRLESTDKASEFLLELGRSEDNRSNLAAYSNAVASLKDTFDHLINLEALHSLAHESPSERRKTGVVAALSPPSDNAASINMVLSLCHQDLVDLAVETVAVEQCEQQLDVYEQQLDSKNSEDLHSFVKALTTVKDARLAQVEKLLGLKNALSRTWGKIRSPDGRSPWGLGSLARDMVWLSTGMNQAFIKIAVASFGAATLLVPMLIMQLHPGIITALVTPAIAVVLIGGMLALFMPGAELKDVAGTTIAYAAVLVVFVGTSAGSTEGITLAYGGKVAGIVLGSFWASYILVVLLTWLVLRSLPNRYDEVEERGEMDFLAEGKTSRDVTGTTEPKQPAALTRKRYRMIGNQDLGADV